MIEIAAKRSLRFAYIVQILNRYVDTLYVDLNCVLREL